MRWCLRWANSGSTSNYEVSPMIRNLLLQRKLGEVNRVLGSGNEIDELTELSLEGDLLMEEGDAE